METHIFKKTASGHEEMSSRRHGLTAGLRRLLLFIDGKRPLAEAVALSSCGGLDDVLKLLEAGLIEEVVIVKAEPKKKETDGDEGVPFFMGDN